MTDKKITNEKLVKVDMNLNELSNLAVTTKEKKTLTAMHSGSVQLLPDVFFEAHILPDKKRVFGQRESARIFALTGGGGGGFTRMASGKSIGSYMNEKTHYALKNPIYFKPSYGGPGHSGYEVSIIIDVCHAIVTAWENGELVPIQQELGSRALSILKATSKLGIIALVDSSLGYTPKEQEYKKAYEKFLLDEAGSWIKEFQMNFMQCFTVFMKERGINQKSS